MMLKQTTWVVLVLGCTQEVGFKEGKSFKFKLIYNSVIDEK